MTQKQTGHVRVQKYLADCGVCSRRKAEVLMEEGCVLVNGKIAKLGDKVIPGSDVVKVEGRRVKPSKEETVALIMNKPRGYVCSHDDPFEIKTIYTLLPPQFAHMKLMCAGRLDKDSQGMLILTNDGELIQSISHPSKNVVKRYQVKLSKPFNPDQIDKMLKGVHYKGERLKAAAVFQAEKGADKEYRIEIHLKQGRKREIRRMCEALGYFVKRLRRTQIGKLVMKGIPPGTVRLLSQKEISLLFSK